MTIKTTFCFLVLALLSACGGGSTAPHAPASSLSYQDPTATGYRLLRNAASTPTHLVLDLVGPSGATAKGVALFLEADPARATWVHPTGATGTVVAPGAVFPLGAAPQMLKDRVEGGVLQVGLFQKGGAATVLGSAPILTLALDLKASASVGTVLLSVPTGKQPQVLNADGTLTSLTISLGTLSAQ